MSQSSRTTILADGQITASPHDTIIVELVEPDGMVRIGWPLHPTVVPSARYTEVAALATRLLANSSTELARLQAARKR